MARKDYKYHFIYKTVNKMNGKYYIGMHSTNNLDDEYLGSGQMLWHSIKKYGKENFSKEILEFLPDRKALNEREEQIVNKEIVSDPLCMNLRTGGQKSPGTYGKKYSDESRKKMSEWKRPDDLGEKISKKLKGKKLTDKHAENIRKGKLGTTYTEEHCENIAKKLRNVPKSETAKLNMRKPQTKITCPYCKKEGGISSIKRWHFDNCKYRHN